AEIAFEITERFLHLHELEVALPEFRGIGGGEIGAQKIAAFAAAGVAQTVPVQLIVKALRSDLRALWRQRENDMFGVASGGLGGGSERLQQRVAGQRPFAFKAELPQRFQIALESAAAHGAL